MTEWKTQRAEDFCLSVRDGTHDSPKPVEQGRKLITSRHMISGRLDLENAYLIDPAEFNEINRRSKVDQWDVLISMIGTVGEVYLEKEVPEYAIKNIGLFKSVSELRGKWLYYYLKTPSAKQELRSRCRGTTQQYVPLGELRSFPVQYPESQREQELIVNLLGTLDDKIELNRRMSETLEAMAQAIFRDWFVDFGPTRRKLDGATDPVVIMDGLVTDAERAQSLADLFPASLGDDGLPMGWSGKPLRSFGNIVTGKTPSTKVAEFYGTDVPFLKIPDMHGQMYVVETQNMLSKAGALSQKKQTVPKSSVSVSCIATPGLVVLNHRDVQTNQQINTVVPSNVTWSPFLFWSCRRLSDEVMVGGSGGSVFHNMNKSTFGDLGVVWPNPSSLIDSFAILVTPLHEKILSNNFENRTLAATRDLLLPKLMSGEIRLGEAKEMAEEAE